MKTNIIRSQSRISIVLLMILFISISYFSSAQDVRLSQPFSAPLKLNPAMMGANYDLKLNLNQRIQWSSINTGYSTSTLNFLYPVFANNGKDKLDFGLGIQSRQQGAFNTIDLSLAVGYNLQLNESGHNLSVSIYGGYVQSSLDAASLTFDDQYINGSYSVSNPTSESISNEKVTYPDAGFGLLWFYNPSKEDSKMNAYFGVSSFHVHSPNESYFDVTAKLPVLQSYQTGLKLMTDGKLDFSPHIRYASQGGAEELAAGLYVDYTLNEEMKATLGGWYRKNNSAAFILGLRYKMFKLGYSYDVGMSDLNRAVGGLMTHEISLIFELDRAGKKEIEYNPSPWGSF